MVSGQPNGLKSNQFVTRNSKKKMNQHDINASPLELILIRGLPGSGKTTLAKSLVNDAPTATARRVEHVEADQYFTDDEGNFKFDGSFISSAHNWCKERVGQLLAQGVSVVVANTFTRRFEMKPYVELARKFNADLTIAVATGQYENIHNVPANKIAQMRDRWEDHEPLLNPQPTNA